MKKTLTCLLILFVASALTLTIVPYASSQTSNVQILNDYTFYQDSIGNLVVIGEIQNTGSSVIANISITGSIATDQITAQGSGAVYANYLLPGQKAPFYMDFYSQGSGSADWTSVTKQDIQLAIYKVAQTSEYPYQNVKIISSEATPKANGEYWVTAQLQNNGTETAQGVVVAATFFNSEGQACGSGYIDPVSSIAAGATTTVKVPCWDLNQTIVASTQKITAYSLLVQVQSPLQTDGNIPVVSNNPTPVPAGTTGATDTTGATGTTAVTNGTQTTGTDQTTTIILAIAVTVTLIVIAAIFIVKRRKPAQTEAFEPAEHTKTTRRERRNE